MSDIRCVQGNRFDTGNACGCADCHPNANFDTDSDSNCNSYSRAAHSYAYGNADRYAKSDEYSYPRTADCNTDAGLPAIRANVFDSDGGWVCGLGRDRGS